MALLVVSVAALSLASAGSALAVEGPGPDLAVSNIAGGSLFSGIQPPVDPARTTNQRVEVGL